MPVCANCEGKFPNRMKIDGKYRVLAGRKYCLECSPFQGHNTRRLHVCEPGKKHCRRCDRTLDLTDFYQRRKEGGPTAYCKGCTNAQTTERHQYLKGLAIEYKGGKCFVCGYTRCRAAMEFHHVDPSMKDFSICSRKARYLNEEFKTELDKCVLLCCRCHREVEAGIIPPLGVEPRLAV
jgi:hypothetical protein